MKTRATIVLIVLILCTLTVGCTRVQVTTTGLMETAPTAIAGSLMVNDETRELTTNANMYLFIKGESLEPGFTIKTQVKQKDAILPNSVDEFTVSTGQPPTNDPELLKKYYQTTKDQPLVSTVSSNPQQRSYLIVLSKFLTESIYPKGEPLKLEVYVNERLVAWHNFRIRMTVHIPRNMIMDTVGATTPNSTDTPDNPDSEDESQAPEDSDDSSEGDSSGEDTQRSE